MAMETKTHMSDLRWEHLPVLHGETAHLGEHWNWHRRQLEDAIASVNRYCPGALRCIPEAGFHVLVGRWVREPQGERPDNLVTVVSIEEDEQRWTYPRVVTVKSVVEGMVNTTGLESLGTSYNPLLTMLEDIADLVPQQWPAYVKWRRRHRREPVPDWLLKLRDRRRDAQKMPLP